MTTPALPAPDWRRLSDGWHVELIQGARRTACNREFNSDRADKSTTAMPTHCDRCRLHYRAELKRLREAPAAPAPSPASDLQAQVLAALGDLKQAVGALRGKQGRDAVRSLTWGKTLDAIDAGRDKLHPDDQLATLDDRTFVRWLLGKPVQAQRALVLQVSEKATSKVLLLQDWPLPDAPDDAADTDPAIVVWVDDPVQGVQVLTVRWRHGGQQGDAPAWCQARGQAIDVATVQAWCWLPC